MTQLHNIIRNSPTMYWTHDNDTSMEVLCDGHAVWRVAFPLHSSTADVLAKRFDGREPLNGIVLNSVKSRKHYEVSESQNRDRLLEMINTDADYCMADTGLTIDLGDSFADDKRQLHAFCVSCSSGSDYVFIDQKYRDCLYQPDNLYAVKPKRTSPLIFESRTSDERAFILPINTDVPPFLAQLR